MSKPKKSIDKQELVAILNKTSIFMSKYRLLIIFLISSLAVLTALLQTNSLLNPVRNETRYSEGIQGIKYTTIDQEIVDKLENSLNDKDITVNPQLVPDRNNPFTE